MRHKQRFGWDTIQSYNNDREVNCHMVWPWQIRWNGDSKILYWSAGCNQVTVDVDVDLQDIAWVSDWLVESAFWTHTSALQYNNYYTCCIEEECIALKKDRFTLCVLSLWDRHEYSLRVIWVKFSFLTFSTHFSKCVYVVSPKCAYRISRNG